MNSFCSMARRLIRIVTVYKGLLTAEKMTKFVLETFKARRLAFKNMTIFLSS